MAEQLVAAMTGEFDPADYRDEYREALDAGHRGEDRGPATLSRSRRPRSPRNLVDLMAALEASVNAATKAARTAGEARVGQRGRREGCSEGRQGRRRGPEGRQSDAEETARPGRGKTA